MKVFLVDDHSVFREALSNLLTVRDPKVEIVGEASNAREAMAALNGAGPELVIMDIVLRGMNGIAATRELRRHGYKGRVLILTALNEPGFVADAFASGADGYALKEGGADELREAIDRVTRGRRYLAPGLEAPPVPARAKADGSEAAEGGVMSALSLREREIFNLVVGGYTNQRMATELFISIKTVETHRSRINRKLCVHSTGELIRFAAVHGLVSN